MHVRVDNAQCVCGQRLQSCSRTQKKEMEKIETKTITKSAYINIKAYKYEL